MNNLREKENGSEEYETKEAVISHAANNNNDGRPVYYYYVDNDCRDKRDRDEYPR